MIILSGDARFRALTISQDIVTQNTQSVPKNDINSLKDGLLGKFQNFLEKTDMFGLFLHALTFFSYISDFGSHTM